jgi:hypothetical protein
MVTIPKCVSNSGFLGQGLHTPFKGDYHEFFSNWQYTRWYIKYHCGIFILNVRTQFELEFNMAYTKFEITLIHFFQDWPYTR